MKILYTAQIDSHLDNLTINEDVETNLSYTIVSVINNDRKM